MAIGIETARSAYIVAAHVFDHPEKFGPQSSHYTVSKVALAKVYATDVQIMVANKAMELMGSYGYVRDYDIEKYWRDGKIIQLWMGGAQLGRFDIMRGYYVLKL
jgi:alkylation response protein AidB-like acyl-CoA dehydrogenase